MMDMIYHFIAFIDNTTLKYLLSFFNQIQLSQFEIVLFLHYRRVTKLHCLCNPYLINKNRFKYLA